MLARNYSDPAYISDVHSKVRPTRPNTLASGEASPLGHLSVHALRELLPSPAQRAPTPPTRLESRSLRNSACTANAPVPLTQDPGRGLVSGDVKQLMKDGHLRKEHRALLQHNKVRLCPISDGSPEVLASRLRRSVALLDTETTCLGRSHQPTAPLPSPPACGTTMHTLPPIQAPGSPSLQPSSMQMDQPCHQISPRHLSQSSFFNQRKSRLGSTRLSQTASDNSTDNTQDIDLTHRISSTGW